MRARLRAVVNAQREELNVLSYVMDSNAARDVQAKKDMSGGAGGHVPWNNTAQARPVALPEVLWVDRQQVRAAESRVSKIVTPMIAGCK